MIERKYDELGSLYRNANTVFLKRCALNLATW